MNIASNGHKSSDIGQWFSPYQICLFLRFLRKFGVKDDVLQECTCNCQFHCILCFVDLVGRGVGRSIPDP